MTKDTRDLTQFNTVACREFTVPREEEASQPKGWIQGNTKIGPVLEVATSYLHGQYGVEVIIMSLNRDNTHSWVSISHGSRSSSRSGSKWCCKSPVDETITEGRGHIPWKTKSKADELCSEQHRCTSPTHPFRARGLP